MKLAPLELPGAIMVCRNLRAADLRELNACRWADLDPDDLAYEIVRQWGANGPGWLVLDRAGMPTALFGATQPWAGMFSAWMVATDNFPAVGLPLTKFVKRVFIPHLCARAHRVEARSIDGHAHAHKWLRALGAVEECRIRAYGRDGEDFVVFALAVARDASSVDICDALSTSG
jgi:hypothetical protein